MVRVYAFWGSHRRSLSGRAVALALRIRHAIALAEILHQNAKFSIWRSISIFCKQFMLCKRETGTCGISLKRLFNRTYMIGYIS